MCMGVHVCVFWGCVHMSMRCIEIVGVGEWECAYTVPLCGSLANSARCV